MTKPNHPIAGPSTYVDAGLTKREHFAAIALQGLITSHYSSETDPDVPEASDREIAQLAVQQADALIDELNRKDT